MQSRQRSSPYPLHRRPMVFGATASSDRPPSSPPDATPLTPIAYTPRHLLCGLALGAVSWVLTDNPLLFSVNPLPLALLCATPRYILWVLCGALLSLGTSQSSSLYALALVLATLTRLLVLPFLCTPRAHRGRALSGSWGKAKQRLQELGRLWQRSEPSSDGQANEKTDKLPFYLWQTNESVALRVTVAVLCALIPAIGLPVAGGFAYYDLYGAAFYLLLMPVATAALSAALDVGEQEEAGLPLLRAVLNGHPRALLGCALAFWSVCFCARSTTIFGISPAVCLVLLVSLTLSRRHRFLLGLCAALLGGLGIDVRSVPLFLIVLLLDALLYPLVRSFSLLPTLLAALVYGLLRGGTDMFWALAPSLSVGVLCFSCVERLAHARPLSPSRPPDNTGGEQNETQLRLLCEHNRNDVLLRRMSSAAGAFSHLSEVFRQLNETLCVPTPEEIRGVCDEVLKESCPNCPQKGACWGENYSVTLNSVLSLCRAIADGTDVESVDFAIDSEQQCLKRQDVIGEVNFRVTQRLRQQLYSGDRSQFSHVYDSISHLLRDIVHQSGNGEADFCYDADTSEKMMTYLHAKGIHPKTVTLMGKRKQLVQIHGLSPANITVSEQQLREDLGRICGAVLGPPRYDGSDEGVLTLSSLPPLRADYVHRCSGAPTSPDNVPTKSSSPKGTKTKLTSKRTVCGDTLRAFEGPDGMFYALLCDGMGSGKNAALTSGSSAVFLEQLLKGGVSVQTALRMLNQYLRTRSGTPQEECCCTVDLFALDLYTGKARFIKSGAACSFLLRKGRLYRICSHTIPIGILQAIDAQVIPFDMQAGDHVLLMSDGITDTATLSEEDSTADGIQARPCDDWLSELLSEAPSAEQESSDSPYSTDSTLIERTFALARKHGSMDDISMMSIRIEPHQAQASK